MWLACRADRELDLGAARGDHVRGGPRFDCGTRLGLVEATIRYALDHEALSDAARGMMQNALSEMGVIDLD